jgi:hypothetical protein
MLAFIISCVKSILTFRFLWKIHHLFVRIPDVLSTYHHARQRLWLKIFSFDRFFPTNGCNKLLVSLKASSPMKMCGRVGPSVPDNTLCGGSLRLFAYYFFFLHRSEFLNMDESSPAMWTNVYNSKLVVESQTPNRTTEK